MKKNTDMKMLTRLQSLCTEIEDGGHHWGAGTCSVKDSILVAVEAAERGAADDKLLNDLQSILSSLMWMDVAERFEKVTRGHLELGAEDAVKMMSGIDRLEAQAGQTAE